jgi:hypothetical protein
MAFPEHMRQFRDYLANIMIGGSGLEIGAGDVPMRFNEIGQSRSTSILRTRRP